MQATGEIRNVLQAFCERGEATEIEDLKLTFNWGESDDEKSFMDDLTDDQKIAVSKIGWMTAVGMNPQIIRQAVEENLGPGGGSRPLLEHKPVPPRE